MFIWHPIQIRDCMRVRSIRGIFFYDTYGFFRSRSVNRPSISTSSIILSSLRVQAGALFRSLAVIFAVMSSVHAGQSGGYEDGADARETVIIFGGKTCILDGPDGTRQLSFSCLNALLTAVSVPGIQIPDVKARDIVGRGNPEAMATFSYTALSIMLGNNFGHSVIPQRENTSFSSVLLSGGK